MSGNYAAIILDNINALYKNETRNAEAAIGAERNGDAILFKAFGGQCVITPEGISLDGRPLTDPSGVVVSLYALHAVETPMKEQPFKAFKEMDDSMPYAGAFATHTENILVPKVEAIKARLDGILEKLDGTAGPDDMPGDFSMVVQPLPKIRLCYIFYLPDDDFPASVTCLFSNNAGSHMPTDGLADVGEYTSRTILNLL
ncbi:protein of unknown function [Desulfatibacillum alkenivorans DSM 16219]|jgi:hypothetical protein|uniref:DUF3786 domain-containing protein n=1 Tax=Desulfatibacillum alkenivorans DSM 16219 TaxID=1121393 RepID=A0A1M6CXQ7_9BACT|nr:DUF3786 domain-containing protein [Desulfatibacillum alkenivorans]SHI65777.1 protein of unknown function [Desulfatibacillum alkenivorans DSM 16219]